jgi:hypothetical protein
LLSLLTLLEQAASIAGFHQIMGFLPNQLAIRAAGTVSKKAPPLALQDGSIETGSTTMTCTTDAILQQQQTFEPMLPDTSTLLGFACIILFSALAVWVWANQVVPVSRTNLALSKKRGPVKDYLDELRNINNNTGDGSDLSNDQVPSSNNSNNRNLERWLFADWLRNNDTKTSGRQKKAALPVLENAKWNSGDNPVLAASALILLGVMLSSILERVASLLQ